MNSLYVLANTTPHISVKADEVFSIFGISITNSHLLGVLGLAILIIIMLRTAKVARGEAKAGFGCRVMLWAIDGLYKTVDQIMPSREWTKKIAPLTITIFFFVLAQYWLGLLPIVGPITFGEHHTPLLRGGVADLNMTFGLAIITIISAQIYAFKFLGFRGNMGRYFVSPLKNPIMTFVGLLELIAEFSRLLGLSFRLFGNVLAGEILLVMISFLTSYLTPLAIQPFYLFELFIGTIQAYIFFMLSNVFISLGLEHHGDDEEKHTQSDEHPSADLAKQTAKG